MVLHLPVALAAVSEAVQSILLQVTASLNALTLASAVVPGVLHHSRLVCSCVLQKDTGPCWKMVHLFAVDSASLQDAASWLFVP